MALTLCLLGCGEESSATPAIAVLAPKEPIPFGQGFALSVERRFPQDAATEPFDPRGLGPFMLVPLGVERRAIAGGIEEIHRFRAHAFSLGSLAIPPQRLVLRVEPSGDRIECLSPPVTIELTSALDEGDSLALELPASRAQWPESELRWTALCSGVALLALIGLLRLNWPRRRPLPLRAEPTAEEPERVDPWAQFERRLAELRADADALEARALHEALYAAWTKAMQAKSKDARERTAVEWRVLLRVSGGGSQSTEAFLAAEDRWRFAPTAADPGSKIEALRLAEASVLERRAEEGGRP